MIEGNKVKRLACTISPLPLAILVGCSSTPPKPTTPPITLQNATQLLNRNPRADNWLKYVQRNYRQAACEYKLELPDQTNHPTEIDLDHIVWCGNRPSPKEFDASVSFEYDKAAGYWVIKRFSS
jgi:hypothetical protein